MSLNIQCKHRGEFIDLKVLINRSDEYDHMESGRYDINNLAVVNLSFKASKYIFQSEIVIKKRPIAGTVKIKVFSDELKHHTEWICCEQECRYVMGSNDVNVREYNDSYYFISFTITLCAYIAETPALEKLYNDTDTTDFRLSTAEGSVPVHKACLVSHSDVFKKMLSREWKETGEGSMQLPGITLQTLQDLKQYMYQGILPEQRLLPLLEIASCYMIKDLRDICLLKLTWNVKAEDYYSLLQYSMDHEIPELTFSLIQATPRDVVENARIINMENVNDAAEEE